MRIAATARPYAQIAFHAAHGMQARTEKVVHYHAAVSGTCTMCTDDIALMERLIKQGENDVR